jgi:hypothetical protein
MTSVFVFPVMNSVQDLFDALLRFKNATSQT